MFDFFFLLLASVMRDRFAEGVANAAIARRSLLEIESRWDISCSVLVDLVSRLCFCFCK